MQPKPGAGPLAEVATLDLRRIARSARSFPALPARFLAWVRRGDRGWLLAVAMLWIVLGLLPLALLTSTSVALADQAVRNEAQSRVETTASAGQVVVEQQLGWMTQLVGSYAQRPETRRAIEHGGGKVLEKYFRELQGMHNNIGGLVLADAPEGRLVAAAPPGSWIGSKTAKGLYPDLRTTDWYQAVSSRRQPYVSQAYTPTIPQATYRAIAVAAPILEPGGRLRGVLAVVYTLDAIREFAREAAEAQGIRMLITDQSGVLVADPGRRLYALTSLREDPRVDAALAGRTLFTRHRSFDQVVLSASRPIPSVKWTVTAEVPASTALAAAGRLRTGVLSIAGLLAVLILVGLGFQLHTSRGRRRAQHTLAEYAEALGVARDAAVRASTAKTEFLGKVSHEIRTPINGVLGMNDLLLGTDLDDEQRHYAGTVHGSAQNLLRLLDDFLDLSKIESGHLVVAGVPFDLPRLCDEVVAPLAPQAYARGLWLTLRLADDLPQRVVGDPERLHQILTNLLGNAMKFTQQGGIDLEVTLDADEGDVPRVVGHRATLRFTVTDTGMGVDAADREHIFETFRQADAALVQRTRGSGLGLAISRQLTELMGGDIGLDSVEGVGSRFWITIPLEVRTWSSPAAGELRGRRALVADPHGEDRALAVRVLTGAGLDVEETADASAALAALRAAAEQGRPFDLAVLDLDLESAAGANGSAAPPANAAGAILADPLLGTTRLVVLITPGRTGGTWPGNPGGPVRDRAVQPVARPLSRRRLLAAVENVLRNADDRAASSAEPEAPGGDPPARILVVEDDEVSRRLATVVLRKAGHEVDVAGDGEEAVREVLSGRYELVFMDCQLPVLDGLAATAEIRRRQQTDAVRIVAMTAAAMPDDRARCLDAGMDDYLTKPVDWKQVLTRVPGWITSPAIGGPGGRPAARAAGLTAEPLDDEAALELLAMPADDLAEIVDAFVSTAPQTLRLLVEAVELGDLAEVGRLAHRLAGGCGAVGAARAAALSRRIEDACDGVGGPESATVAELAEEMGRASAALISLTGGRASEEVI